MTGIIVGLAGGADDEENDNADYNMSLTHHPPIIKVAVSNHLRCVDILSCQTRGTGSPNIMKSVKMLKMPMTNDKSPYLIQTPDTVGSHNAASGTHWKIAPKNADTAQAMIKTPMTFKLRLNQRCGKMRLYRKRIESLTTTMVTHHMHSIATIL